MCCVLFYFYIKPQLALKRYEMIKGCVLFYFYIKPQLPCGKCAECRVVSYSISTSNHNCDLACAISSNVVSYSISTSNHNFSLNRSNSIICCVLFYFYIKPQLFRPVNKDCDSCVLFYFYIKPQPQIQKEYIEVSCVLFYFYIKPQLVLRYYLLICVVSYSISTSNHN